MKKIYLLAVGLCYALICLAQKTITGKVTDASTKEPLSGASVVAKGGTQGTATNANGEFTLTVPNSVTMLSISYVGYQLLDYALGTDLSQLNIGLIKADGLNEVIVTGSRNTSRTRVETPVPVDIIPVSTPVKDIGQFDLNQILNYVAPSFQSARQTIADGTDHIDPAQLRGLGSDQVLVLVNGKRRHQSALVNVNGTVNRGQVGTDLSAIPATAIERIEVLRDGAAAQYGSDAIAGVINVVLKKNTGVLSGNVSYGFNSTAFPRDYAINRLAGKDPNQKTSINDGGNFQAGINYGLRLGQKGYLNLNAEYLMRNPTVRSGTYTGAVYPNVNGVNRDDSIMAARGLNRNFFDMRIGQSKITSGSVYFNGMTELGGTWQLNFFGGFNQKNGEAAGFYRYPSAIATGAGIYRNQALAVYPDGFLPMIKTDIKDISASVGASGKLGKWDASISNTLGTNIFDYTVDNSLNYSQFAVGNTPAQTRFNAGGIRLLQNTVNADMAQKFDLAQGLNIAFGAEQRIEQYQQVAGEEASYRNYNTAAGAAAGSQVFPGFQPNTAGKFTRNSIALYSDNELDITKAWMVSAALRFENYSDFGSTLNYKVATRYKVAPFLSLRAATSTGFRAPSMQQRFYARTNTLFVTVNGQLTPVESGTFTNDSRPAQILGIPKLKQETSVNYSAGLTLTPAKGLEITVDGYIININDRIVLTNNFTGGNNPQLQQQLNAAGAQTANFFTNAIDTRSRGLEAVANYAFTINRKHNIRLTVAYTYIDNKVRDSANGNPFIKASPTLIASGQIANYFNREDESRVEVANPRSKANFMVSYRVGKFNTMLRFAYFGKTTYWDPTINPANPGSWPVNAFTNQRETLDQVFAGKTVTDLSLGYQLTKALSLTVGANNLFDVYQDLHTHSGNMSLGRFLYSRRVQQMGFNGRFLFARVGFSL